MTPSDTEARILAAAAELIAERGYTGTTTSAIASIWILDSDLR